MKRFFFWIVLWVGLSGFAETPPQEAPSMDTELLQLLKTAERNDYYKVNILTREWKGKTQTIVLLGEAHVKGGKASEMGQEIIDKVNLIGKEGFQTKRYWTSSVFVRVYILWPRELLHWAGVPGMSEESTTKDAKEAAETGNLKRLVELEENHDPDLFEQGFIVYLSGLAILYPPILTYSSCKWALGKLGDQPWAVKVHDRLKAQEPWLKQLRKWHHLLGLPLLAINLASSAIPGSTIGIIGNRNETMADALVSALDEEEEESSLMLAIVGWGHQHGMVRLLETEHGFLEFEE